MEICYIEPEIKKDAKTNTPALAGGNEIEEVRGGSTAHHGNGHGLFRPGNPRTLKLNMFLHIIQR